MPSAVKTPAAVQRPAAAVKKWPAGALSPKTIPDVKKRPAGDVLSPSQELRAAKKSLKQPESPSSVSSSSTDPPIPHNHRQLSIDSFAGKHLEDLGPHQAGEVVLEALSALRRMVEPDFTFAFAAPDPVGTAKMMFFLHRFTDPIGTYGLEVELCSAYGRRGH